MENLLDSIRKALTQNNLYIALFASLTLPDICGKIEFPNKVSSIRYIEWFEKYLPKYNRFLSGSDCYALRCSLLHEGSDNISDQQIQQVLEHFIFLSSGGHCNVVLNSYVGTQNKESFLQLNTLKFCEDICSAVDIWKRDVSTSIEIKNRLNKIIKIHEPGYSYNESIKFG